MHGSVINVLTNVAQIQFILLTHDGVIICVFFKQHLEYKSLYMLGNVHPNMVMVVLQNLIETSLYKYSNVAIYHQWVSLFILYVNSKFQIPIHNNASFNNEKIYYTLIDSMIHKFLNVPKIMNYDNIIYSIAPNKKFHLLNLFKYKHLKELNFSTLFYRQLR